MAYGGLIRAFPALAAMFLVVPVLWWLVEWVRPIIDILMHGVNETVDYQMQSVLPITPDGVQNYYRMQVVLDPTADKMDDVSPGNMRSLRLLAEEFIRKNDFTFDRLCRQLVE